MHTVEEYPQFSLESPPSTMEEAEERVTELRMRIADVDLQLAEEKRKFRGSISSRQWYNRWRPRTITLKKQIEKELLFLKSWMHQQRRAAREERREVKARVMALETKLDLNDPDGLIFCALGLIRLLKSRVAELSREEEAVVFALSAYLSEKKYTPPFSLQTILDSVADQTWR